MPFRLNNLIQPVVPVPIPTPIGSCGRGGDLSTAELAIVLSCCGVMLLGLIGIAIYWWLH